jgi:hypothetical protein
MDYSDFVLLISVLHSLPVEWTWDEEFEITMKNKKDMLTLSNYTEFQMILSYLFIKDFNQCTQKYMIINSRRNMRYNRPKWNIKLTCAIFAAPECQGDSFDVDFDSEFALSCEPTHTMPIAKFPFARRESILRHNGLPMLRRQVRKLRKMNLLRLCESTPPNSSSSSDHEDWF